VKIEEIEGVGATYAAKLSGAGVNQVDLMRIDGVGSEYADLLEAAGVDSVPELAQRNAANLAAALESSNDQKSVVRRAPSEAVVANLISEAGSLPTLVTH
jgi:predicted flap endonuclease-1-like 5' DNA nuclease